MELIPVLHVTIFKIHAIKYVRYKMYTLNEVLAIYNLKFNTPIDAADIFDVSRYTVSTI